MLTFNHRVASEFSKLLAERTGSLAEGVLGGRLEDIAAYKLLTGHIRGLKDAEEILQEAIAICEGKGET